MCGVCVPLSEEGSTPTNVLLEMTHGWALSCVSCCAVTSAGSLCPCQPCQLFSLQVLCGPAAVTGSVWMAPPRRCSRRRQREPRPIPTPATAPSLLPLLLSIAAKPVGCTSTAPPARWVLSLPCRAQLPSFTYRHTFDTRILRSGHSIWEKTAHLASGSAVILSQLTGIINGTGNPSADFLNEKAKLLIIT